MPPALIGCYTPPRVRKGRRVTCLYRDAECAVTGLHDAPIPWPRVRALGSQGGSGLWVNGDLLRAIRTESVEAVAHWFGVSTTTAWRWRRAFGVKQWGTEGSKRLHRQASAKGAAAIKARDWTDEELDARAELARRLRGGRPPCDRWAGRHWTAEQEALLGTAPDDVIGGRVGRSENAVRVRRTLRRIPTFKDRRRRGSRR